MKNINLQLSLTDINTCVLDGIYSVIVITIMFLTILMSETPFNLILVCVLLSIGSWQYIQYRKLMRQMQLHLSKVSRSLILSDFNADVDAVTVCFVSQYCVVLQFQLSKPISIGLMRSKTLTLCLFNTSSSVTASVKHKDFHDFYVLAKTGYIFKLYENT